MESNNKETNQGAKSIREGKRNRRLILSLLQKQPLTFTEIAEEVKLSQKTVSFHLKFLLKRDYIKKTVKGEKIVYEVIEPTTILEMRKDFWNELVPLTSIFYTSLNEKTLRLLHETINALRESIEKPESEAETTKTLVLQKKLQPNEKDVRFTIQHDRRELEE